MLTTLERITDFRDLARRSMSLMRNQDPEREAVQHARLAEGDLGR